MFKNYFLASIRNITRNKTYFTLSVIGLSLGISCAITLYSIINFQKSYDTHQEHFESIYRIVGEYSYGDQDVVTATVPHPLAEAIGPELPTVESISNTFMMTEQVNIPLENGEIKKLKQGRIGFVQAGFFDIISFKWIAGSFDQSSLEGAYVSSSTASKYFDQVDNYQTLLGKTIKLANKHTLQIAGIYQDFPKKTDYPFELIVDYSKQQDVNPYYNPNGWGTLNGRTQCILRLQPEADRIDAENNAIEIFNEHNQIEGYNIRFQPFSKVHTEPYGNYSGVVFQPVFEVISYTLAIFLCVIGSINFINLTTARAVKRAKEVGIRKVMGSSKSNLVFQFLFESFLMISFAIFVGFIGADQMLKFFESLMGQALSVSDIAMTNWVLFTVVTLFGMTVLSGLYPAWLLARFPTLSAIKTRISNIDQQSRLPLRKILVGVQFGFSVMLIISAMVIFFQMNYMRDFDMGFKQEGIVSLVFPEPDKVNQQRLMMMLEQEPEFLLTSLQLGGPMARTNNTDKYFNPEIGEDEFVQINVKSVDENYLDLYEIPLISGRNLLNGEPEGNVLISRLSLDKFNLGTAEGAVGKTIQSHQGKQCKIVGVMEDFYVNSLNDDQMPVMLKYREDSFYELAIALSDAGKKDVAASLAKIESTWDQVYPDLLMEYDFLDERLAKAYTFQEVFGKGIAFFVVIAMIISILGLYGLTDFMANARRKEIGIRKVVGAERNGIVLLFIKEVFSLLIVAFLVASSVSYWLMNQWLNNFESRIEFGWELLLGAFIVTLLVSAITMSYRTLGAANLNPVNVLKDE